ncbi:MAG: hypothetical protein ACKO2G_00905, partial [Verrucomicrobiales bacterium]
TIPFSNVWTSNRASHEANATTINRYLTSTEESLSVVQSGKTVRIIGYVFFGLGLLMLFSGLWGIIKAILLISFAVSKGG